MDIYYVDCVNSNLLEKHDKFGNLPFRIQKIVLNPQNKITNEIINESKKRFKKINFNSVDSSGKIRNEDEKRYKSFCGLIIEQLAYELLTHYNNKDNVRIVLDDSTKSIDQIDLTIEKSWKDSGGEWKTKTYNVEIRASFPICPIEKSVSNNFDILGPYTNNTKQVEKNKDFYIRFLICLDYKNNEKFVIKGRNNKISYSESSTNLLKSCYFDEFLNLKQNLTIYFVGGATNSMMNDESIAYNGYMNSNYFNKNKEGKFKKIKLRNSLDCISIMRLMLNVITDETSIEK